jgi:uncharacterized membrane protein YcaP (DUF421 family)
VFFDSWNSLGRVALGAVVAYASLLLLLRLSGKRTLSKLNAFDLVVTVALGSTLAAVILDRSVALLDGVTALASLIVLQYVVALAASRSRRASRLFKSEPRVLFRRGAFARAAMRDERITEDEIVAAFRRSQVPDLDGVEEVVLESSGDLSVVRYGSPRPRGAPVDVLGVPVRPSRDEPRTKDPG